MAVTKGNGRHSERSRSRRIINEVEKNNTFTFIDCQLFDLSQQIYDVAFSCSTHLTLLDSLLDYSLKPFNVA